VAAQDLPSFEEVRSQMYRLLGDAQDVAQSARRDNPPTRRKAQAFARARKAIAAAKTALNDAAD
jgi:hypothetical protein